MALDHYVAGIDRIVNFIDDIPLIGGLVQLVPGVGRSNDKRIRTSISDTLNRRFHKVGAELGGLVNIHNRIGKNNIYEFFDEAFDLNRESVIENNYVERSGIFRSPRLTWEGIKYIIQKSHDSAYYTAQEILPGQVKIQSGVYSVTDRLLKEDFSFKDIGGLPQSFLDRFLGPLSDLWDMFKEYAFGGITVNASDRNVMIKTLEMALTNEDYNPSSTENEEQIKLRRENLATLIDASSRKVLVTSGLTNAVTDMNLVNSIWEVRERDEIVKSPISIYGTLGEGALEFIKSIPKNEKNKRARMPGELGGWLRLGLVVGGAALTYSNPIGPAAVALGTYALVPGALGFGAEFFVSPDKAKVAATIGGTAVGIGAAALGLAPWLAVAAGFGAAYTRLRGDKLRLEGHIEGDEVKSKKANMYDWGTDILTLISIGSFAHNRYDDIYNSLFKPGIDTDEVIQPKIETQTPKVETQTPEIEPQITPTPTVSEPDATLESPKMPYLQETPIAQDDTLVVQEDTLDIIERWMLDNMGKEFSNKLYFKDGNLLLAQDHGLSSIKIANKFYELDLNNDITSEALSLNIPLGSDNVLDTGDIMRYIQAINPDTSIYDPNAPLFLGPKEKFLNLGRYANEAAIIANVLGYKGSVLAEPTQGHVWATFNRGIDQSQYNFVDIHTDLSESGIYNKTLEEFMTLHKDLTPNDVFPEKLHIGQKALSFLRGTEIGGPIYDFFFDVEDPHPVYLGQLQDRIVNGNVVSDFDFSSYLFKPETSALIDTSYIGPEVCPVYEHPDISYPAEHPVITHPFVHPDVSYHIKIQAPEDVSYRIEIELPRHYEHDFKIDFYEIGSDIINFIDQVDLYLGRAWHNLGLDLPWLPPAHQIPDWT